MPANITHDARDFGGAGRRELLAGAAVLLGALASYCQVLAIFRHELQSYYGIGLTSYGLLLSFGLLPGAVGGIAGGILADRKGPVVVLRWSLLGTALGMALAGCPGPRFGLMLAALAVIGLAMQSLGVAVQVYLIRLYPAQPRRVLSANFVAAGVSAALFPLWGEFLLGWQGTGAGPTFGQVLHGPFVFLTAPLLLGSLFFRNGAAATAPDAPATGPREDRGKGGALMLGLLVMHGVVDQSAFLWMPRVLDSECFAGTPIAPGKVMAAFGMAYVISRTLTAFAPERAGRRVLLVVPGLLGGGIFVAGLLSRNYLLTAGGYVFGAFIWSFEMPAFLAVIAGRNQRRFGGALAAQFLGTGIGGFLMPLAMGWIGEMLAPDQLWRVLLIPGIGFAAVGGGGALWLWRYGHHD